MEEKYYSVTYYDLIICRLTHNISAGRCQAEDKCVRSAVIALAEQKSDLGPNSGVALQLKSH